MYIQTHAYHTLLMNDDRNGNEETANIFISAGKCCAFFFFIQFNYSQKKVKGLLSRAASHTRLETMQRKKKIVTILTFYNKITSSSSPLPLLPTPPPCCKQKKFSIFKFT